MANDAIVFEFLHESKSERFFAITSDSEVIDKARAELQLPLNKRSLHINGVILAGDGGHNSPWSWHLKPSGWDLVEQSIELCDAWPGYVEANRDEWIRNPGRFCPWGSRVLGEIRASE